MGYAIRAALLSAGTLVAMTSPTLAWDYPGHRMVGAIADMVMSAQHPKAYGKVKKLLATTDADGNPLERTLSQVAVFPDCAKTKNVPFCGRTPSAEEKAFAANNKGSSGYHFTDVPIQQTKYVAGNPGTTPKDVVIMINYSVAQLRGKTPHIDDTVKLTDAEAVWLLAHLVGDIHQPLHVGGVYFDKDTCTQVRDPTDPTKFPNGVKDVASTVGGNAIKLVALAPDPAAPPNEHLHFYWDGNVVNDAMRAAGLPGAEQDFARLLAAKAPEGWQTANDPETWAQQWATEILPLAAAAHNQLRIEYKGRDPEHDNACVWKTYITPDYGDWASQRAREQIQKAGFRLAALLAVIFEPQ